MKSPRIDLPRPRALPPASLCAALLAIIATPALAQSAGDWSGGYVGGYAGGVMEPDDGNDRIAFDTNLDGNFDDTVRTGTGADAFSPGSCNGVARAPTPAGGCAENSGGAEFGLRVGYDWQVDNWVFGVVGEYGVNDARDAVTSFSTTPARYTMLRKVDGIAAMRGRVGWAFGDGGNNLLYATGGYAQAQIENFFSTSNTANSFTANGDSDASGAQFGLGYERRIGEFLAVGIEYLATRLDDDEARVRVGPGSAPPTNPFIRSNPNGTDFRRSDEDFDLDSVRLTAVYRF
ncbi:outer membrane protein [Lysobacter koreensis]|uniref:Outer membrane protein n=2 Tax=Lysobacter koreensis TaxID=266122 RepID=A0ABW2YLP9_9GAMM